MGVSLPTVFFSLISIILLVIVAQLFGQPRAPQCAVQTLHTTLPCVSDLLLELRNNAANFEPLTYEFLVRYFKALTVEQQELFYRRPEENEEGFYLKTTSEVLTRLNINPSCGLNHTLPSVAVCVQQHSVGQYMQEWIAHYLLLGASKVVVYDNSNPRSNESRYFRRVVHPFVEAGFVDVVPWFFETGPDLFRPAEAFMDCYNRYKDQFDWIGNFDSDEFLVIYPPLPPCLPAVTQHYSSYGGIAVNWRLVTPVGSLERNSSALLFEQYLWVISDGLRHVKTIYQTKFTSGIDSAHCARYVRGKHVVSPGLDTPSCPFNNVTSESSLYKLMELRHFYGRDLSFFAFDKVCSRTVPGQITYSKIRAQMLIAMLTTKHLSRLTDEGPHAAKLRGFLLT